MRRWLPILLLAISCSESAERAAKNADDSIELFILGFRKPDGGFGSPESGRSHPVWTWQALRSLHLLGRPAAPPAGLVPRIRAWALEERSPDSQIKALLLLQMAGEPPPALPPAGPPFLPLTSWVGSPPLDELEALTVRERMLGREVRKDILGEVLRIWRAGDGGWRYPAALAEVWPLVLSDAPFATLPAGSDGPSPVGATASALACYRAAEIEIPGREQAAARIRDLLDAETGRYRAGVAGHEGTGLWETWQALRALDILAEPPPEAAATDRWIRSLGHRSGGYTHHPGEPASLEATHLALECLSLLGTLEQDHRTAPAQQAALPAAADPGGLRLFQAVVQMGPDPGTSVMLAHRIGARLLLVKSLAGDEERRAALARSVIAAHGLDMEVACVREEHRRAFGVEGIGYATHCSDVMWESGTAIGDRNRYTSFDELMQAWAPARAGGARVMACSYRHRELLAPVYDRSVRGDGYDALMFAWAFAGGGDLVADHPWLHRYAGRIAAVGNHDAHGEPFHWLHRGLRTRTLFFAKEPTFAQFSEALARNRTVAVAHGPHETVLYGHPHWTKKARLAEAEWDAGRTGGSHDPWIPEPLVFGVEASTAELWPGLAEGFAIVVRAARSLTDDAMPGEVDVRIDGEPAAVELLPPRLDGPPALGVRLPAASRGVRQVTVSTRTAEQGELRSSARVRLAEPIDRNSAAPLPRFPAEPRKLGFQGIGELPFVQNTSLDFGDLQGRVRIVCRRADLILGPAPEDARSLVLRYNAGERGRILQVLLDGAPLTEGPLPAGEGRRTVWELPDGFPRKGMHRITVRTDLPPWMESFDRPASDLELLELSWGDLH